MRHIGNVYVVSFSRPGAAKGALFIMKKLFTYFAAMLLMLATACGGAVETVSVGPEGASIPEVLIAVRPSDFKQKIVDKLTERYRESTHLTVIGIDSLDDVHLEDFDAIVVLGARRGFLLFSGEERHFLDRLKTPERAVMVVTAAVRDWKWDDADIDVITGASEPAYEAPILDGITSRLDAVLQNR